MKWLLFIFAIILLGVDHTSAAWNAEKEKLWQGRQLRKQRKQMLRSWRQQEYVKALTICYSWSFLGTTSVNACVRKAQWDFGTIRYISEQCPKYCKATHKRILADGKFELSSKYSDWKDKRIGGYDQVVEHCKFACRELWKCEEGCDTTFVEAGASISVKPFYDHFRCTVAKHIVNEKTKEQPSCRTAYNIAMRDNGHDCPYGKCYGFTWMHDYKDDKLHKGRGPYLRRRSTVGQVDNEVDTSDDEEEELDRRSPMAQCLDRHDYKEMDFCLSECPLAQDLFTYDDTLTCDVLGAKGKSELLALYGKRYEVDVSDATDAEYEQHLAGPGRKCCTVTVTAKQVVNVGWGSSEHALGPFSGCMERTGNWTEHCSSNCYLPQSLFEQDGTGNLTCKALGDSDQAKILSLIGDTLEVDLSTTNVPEAMYDEVVSKPGELCCAIMAEKTLRASGAGWKPEATPVDIPRSHLGLFSPGMGSSVTASLIAIGAAPAVAIAVTTL